MNIFCYFRVGDQVSFVKKGRFGVVHGSVEEKFSPFHLFIETSSREDFDQNKILQQVFSELRPAKLVIGLRWKN